MIDEELQGDGLPEIRNFLKQNAPSISRNPFEALRKLRGEEENLDRPERDSVLESSSDFSVSECKTQIWPLPIIETPPQRKPFQLIPENYLSTSRPLSRGELLFEISTSCLKKVENSEDEIMEVESVTSVSSAKIEPVEEEEIQTETRKLEDSDSLSPNITKLFSSPKKETMCKSPSIFPSQELVPFLAAYEIELMKGRGSKDEDYIIKH
ncbi:hypothetical protein E5676_scaffold411G002250 [Cucumis melo var. makuwa]|uniref:Uncharacterized protein n=1 Tax=Cucumis melo var. makuwa TaxID=1194695 RepID=A0A5A7UVL9_CUCMM|nr:hypothetical protein E6C27_scaffold497G00330 [Cucumis melo var. makuwa]TYK18282.1 hypothetical protein E5676_scaffold411G002250 [Cucumis melo var. makuwa]